jgi:hypothetical protein
MPACGVFSNAGQGHGVTSILIAIVAVVGTAMSCGRMARRRFSASSSAYSSGFIWIHLSNLAPIAGSVWLAASIAYGAWETCGFRGDLVNFDLPAEEAQGIFVNLAIRGSF